MGHTLPSPLIPFGLAWKALLAGLLRVQEKMKQKEHDVKENLGHFMGTYKKYFSSAHVKPLTGCLEDVQLLKPGNIRAG